MNQLIATDKYSLIVGMGATGLSIARYLHAQQQRFCLFDTRASSTLTATFSERFPEAPQYFGTIDEAVLNGAQQVLLSPGVSREEPIIASALAQNIPVIGDIELFLRAVNKPVIGITGSNGKSTVTTMVGQAAEKSGYQVAVGGNIGIPALDLLQQDSADLYVLELSSFQLESTLKPTLDVACILNVSPDHMDRYRSIAQYLMAKQKIYWGAKNVVYSLDDRLSQPPVANNVQRYGFGLAPSIEKQEKQFYFSADDGHLMADDQVLMHKDEIKMAGSHNLSNALALFAIADAANIQTQACVGVLKTFPGLAHRCQWVSEHNGLTYINDSKATNVGAAQAAILGLAPEYSGLVLIAGGDGKGAEFTELAKSINAHVRAVILIGKDAPNIAQGIDAHVQLFTEQSLQAAVEKAHAIGQQGEAVLLSPACASFDMFSSFEDRGQQFIDAVGGLIS